MWHTVDLTIPSGQFWTNSSPRVSQVPVQLLVAWVAASWQIAATDVDGDNLQYRLATSQEMVTTTSGTQPAGLTLGAGSGIVSFTPPAAGIYHLMVVVSDGYCDIAVDILLQASVPTQYCVNSCTTCTSSAACGGAVCGRADAGTLALSGPVWEGMGGVLLQYGFSSNLAIFLCLDDLPFNFD